MELTREQAAKRFRKRAALVCVCMFLFGFACVPIYRIACTHGYLGPRVQNAPDRAVDASSMQVDTSRWVTVQFVGTVNSKLAWAFAPENFSVKVHPGQLSEAWFDATNHAENAIVGNAVPSIAPNQASLYFTKTECFCFTEQTLNPGESRRMPVKFIVDPKMPADIETLTLSYTFFNNELATKRIAEQAKQASAKPAS
jgi:cytochrome c oxidase assembly protein subunit 11